jgi:hypothetical protein
MLDSNEHYFRERYHIPRIPCGDHLLVCVLYLKEVITKLKTTVNRIGKTRITFQDKTQKFATTVSHTVSRLTVSCNGIMPFDKWHFVTKI